MTPATVFHPACRRPGHARRLAAIVLSVLAWGLIPWPTAAQSCWIPGSTSIDFGVVGNATGKDIQSSVTFVCQGANAPGTRYVRLCVFIPEGAPITGIAPRYMTNYSGAQMKYDLYSDPARSQIIGPPPAGGGFPVYSLTLAVPQNTQPSITIPLYGRVPAGQNLPATNAFQSQINGAVVQWAASNTGTPPPSCSAGIVTGSVQFYAGVRATVSNSCSIAISQASDLDFGSRTALASAVDGASTITLACPDNVSWKVGLDNGQHASGTQRRMQRPAGDAIRYDLYRDPARTQRWGNDTAGGTDTVNGSGAGQPDPRVLTVYGRVPAQALAPPGTYTDTITVTLVY